uniref:Nuclear receptor domain-containing protein n=1 Tax=Acrobeloides nanus TaxID=290746 RepID=A0A914DEZ4_9BILA
MEKDICIICGDKQGITSHYGAISCMECKSFFRGAIIEGQDCRCTKSGNCIINQKLRNKCRACRFKRCIELGMCQDKNMLFGYAPYLSTKNIGLRYVKGNRVWTDGSPVDYTRWGPGHRPLPNLPTCTVMYANAVTEDYHYNTDWQDH